MLNQSAHGEARRTPHENDQGYGDGESCVMNLAQKNEVAIIGIRPFANGAIVDEIKSEKKHDISEDEGRKWHEEAQKITDKFVAEVDKIIQKKEKALIEV